MKFVAIASRIREASANGVARAAVAAFAVHARLTVIRRRVGTDALQTNVQPAQAARARRCAR